MKRALIKFFGSKVPTVVFIGCTIATLMICAVIGAWFINWE
jgi:hypothetical protein